MSIYDTASITIFEAVAEPFSLPPVNNAPAQLAIGTTATYMVSIIPPDTEITWSSSDTSVVNFVGGNTGNNVAVKGISLGDTKLTANIKGFTGEPPEFNISATPKLSVKARIWVVCDTNGVPCVSVPYINNKVAEANVWLSQKGMDLQIESISYTNRADWLTFTNSTVASETLRYLPHPGDSLKIVFVNHINNARGFCGRWVIGIGLDATNVTLAHEVCHQGGLKDIYPARGNFSIYNIGVTQKGRMDDKDWGAGYYQNNLLHTDLITRCLMYYTHHTNRGHIPHGSVYGVYIKEQVYLNGQWVEIIDIGDVPVGLNKLIQQPLHPPPPIPRP